LTKKQIQAKVEWVFGEIVNQPALRELLHERADGGSASADPHQPEIAVLE